MLKSFLPGSGSQEVSFWEHYFSAQSFQYLVESFGTDPLRPLFERYCSRGARVLEGGCGLGNYLPCLRRLGARPVGLDFAVDMLAQVRQRESGTPLVAGDVCALPFCDGSLDVYYSGGVMEHFESGPSQPLSEARRVLCRGGILLVSVPFENALRRALAPRTPTRRRELILEAVESESVSAAPDGYQFFQYFYRGPEFRRRLEELGFEVLEERPFSLWRGLADLEPFRWIESMYARGRGAASSGDSRIGAPGVRTAPTGVKKHLKRWIFAEDRTSPVFGPLVTLGCEMAANMRMYVCRRP